MSLVLRGLCEIREVRGRLARPWSDEPQTDRSKTDNFAKMLYSKTIDIDKPVVDRLIDVASERQLPPSQIALAWLLHKSAVTAPIVGATKPNHLDDAVASLSVKLSEEEIRQLEELYQPHAAPEGFS